MGSATMVRCVCEECAAGVGAAGCPGKRGPHAAVAGNRKVPIAFVTMRTAL